MSDHIEYSGDRRFKLEVWETSSAPAQGLCKYSVSEDVGNGLWQTVEHSAGYGTFDTMLIRGRRVLRDAVTTVSELNTIQTEVERLRAQLAERDGRLAAIAAICDSTHEWDRRDVKVTDIDKIEAIAKGETT